MCEFWSGHFRFPPPLPHWLDPVLLLRVCVGGRRRRLFDSVIGASPASARTSSASVPGVSGSRLASDIHTDTVGRLRWDCATATGGRGEEGGTRQPPTGTRREKGMSILILSPLSLSLSSFSFLPVRAGMDFPPFACCSTALHCCALSPDSMHAACLPTTKRTTQQQRTNHNDNHRA